MKILISAGPTREFIDPVRFITNSSSGQMGYALAAAALRRGHDVTLVSGPVSLTPPAGADVVNVVTAAEMAEAMKSRFPHCSCCIMSAAVADYRPAHVHDQKMKKTPGNMLLELERTEDILKALGSLKKEGQLLVGFAAESENLLENCGIRAGADKSSQKRSDTGEKGKKNNVFYSYPPFERVHYHCAPRGKNEKQEVEPPCRFGSNTAK